MPGGTHAGCTGRDCRGDEGADVGAPLVWRQRGAVRKGMPHGDVPGAVARSDARDAAGPIRSTETERAVDGIAVEGKPDERAVHRGIQRDQALAREACAHIASRIGRVTEGRGHKVVVVLAHRRVSTSTIEAVELEEAAVLVPNVLVVVTERVERIENDHPVDENAGMSEPCRRSAARADFGLTRNAEEVVLILRLRRVAV